MIMKTLCIVMVALACAGCVSAVPGSRAGWSFSLVNITVQLGGSRTDPAIDTLNNLEPNATQTHTLPVTADQTAGATSVSLPTP